MGHHLLPSQGLQREPERETEQVGLELAPRVGCWWYKQWRPHDVTAPGPASFVTSLSLHFFSESWGDGGADVTVGFQRRKAECLAPASTCYVLATQLVQTQNTGELWAYRSYTYLASPVGFLESQGFSPMGPSCLMYVSR